MSLPQTPSFRLDGKKALVTGASRGIGLGCAVALAEAGAHVVAAARSLPALEDAVSQMTDAGLSAEAVRLDVDEVESLAAFMASRPAFDVFLNSAGIARHSPALETTPQDFDAVMSTNLRGAFFSSREAARRMIADGVTGSIINISSQMAHVGGIDRAVYAASKHAVEGMTKSMAIEWGGHGVRVNTICPTFIRTPLAEQTLANPERAAWIKSKIKLGRIGEIEDVMGAAVFLAGDAASMITGTALMIDGGWTAG
ncbi:MAG: SDR family oxidoreductase [Hyphomicrobiales bacterium]|nr:SDR family oxidoreductase [Hyphomicrobiales bacterium]